MEEPKRTSLKHDKKMMVINLGKGGGGIGVGIIFLGGALATAALISTVGRRLRKPSNINHDPSTGSTKTTDDKFTKEKNKDESKGLQFVFSDSSPHMHHNISNGMAKPGATETANITISSQYFFLEEKDKFEISSGKEGSVCDDKGILISSFHQELETNIGCDDSILDKDLPLPVIEDQLLLEPANMKDNNGVEIKLFKEDDANEIAPAGRSREEGGQLMELTIEEQRGMNFCNGEEIRELKCPQAAETAHPDTALSVLQASEEKNCSMVGHGLESESTDSSLQQTTVNSGQDVFMPELGNSTPRKDEKMEVQSEEGFLAFETVEATEGDDTIEASEADHDRANTKVLMFEEEEKKRNQIDGLLTSETVEAPKRDEKLDVDQGEGNTTILMFEEEHEICTKHYGSLTNGIVEAVEAAHADQSKSSAAIQMFEDQEEKCHQHDDLLTTEAAQILEEDKWLEAGQTKNKPKIALTKEKGAGDDAQNDAPGETTTVLDSVSTGSDLQMQLIEKQEIHPNDDQQHNSVLDRIASEKISNQTCATNEPNQSLEGLDIPSQSKPEIGIDHDYKEARVLGEATEIKKEDVASKPAVDDRVVESDNASLQPTGKQVVEDTSLTRDADNATIKDHLVSELSEEDSIEDEEDDVEEVIIADKVDECSEGTEDSSADSNAKLIWPAESIQELPMELTEPKLNDQKEKQENVENMTVPAQRQEMYFKNVEDGGITAKTLQNVNDDKGCSEITLLERYMLELAEQKDEPTSLLKRRIPISLWTMLALLWPLCLWYFGLPFLKICLIVILVMVLSKIHDI